MIPEGICHVPMNGFVRHQVDFDRLMSGQRQYVPQEEESLDSYLPHATACKRAVTANV
jgi:hypothetical protein